MLATIAGLLLFAGALLAAIPLLRAVNRRLLWRVRRKLTISYIFIGVVPAILIVAFFLLCGLLLFFNVGGYIVRSRAAIRSSTRRGRWRGSSPPIPPRRRLARPRARRRRIVARRSDSRVGAARPATMPRW